MATQQQTILAFLSVTSAILLFAVLVPWGDTNSNLTIELVKSNYNWAHPGSSQQCVFEIHPKDNRTINSVSMRVIDSSGSYIIGSSSVWIESTKDEYDFLIWRSANFTASSNNYTCVVRVLENTFPGIDETITNDTFYTLNYSGMPGCVGSADCIVTSTVNLYTNQNYLHRNIELRSNINTNNNLNLTATDSIIINTTGAITISSPKTLTITTQRFLNLGTINANGDVNQDASNITFIGVQYFLNSNLINLKGGPLSQGSTSCGSSSGCGYCPTNGATPKRGGAIKFTNATTTFVNTGNIYLDGGTGATSGYLVSCSNPSNAIQQSGTNGGNAGNLTIQTYSFNNSGIISAVGGSAGSNHPSVWWYCVSYCYPAYYQGHGTNNNINITENMTVTGAMTATGYVSGSWNISYCANGTGNNWALITPTAVKSDMACYDLPTVQVTYPNATAQNYTTLLENITVNFTGTDYTGYEIWFSQNNGTTWSKYYPSENIFTYPSEYEEDYTIPSHRLLNSTNNIFRVRVYNSSTKLYSEYSNSSLFNTTLIETAISQAQYPSGSVSTTDITFYCNYTNASTGNAITSPTGYIQLDGNLFNLSYNSTTKGWYYTNTDTTLKAGPHNWSCMFSKANYKPQIGSNVSFNITGFGVFYPPGKDEINIICPFPTISNVVPSGQRAGVGALRIVNYDNTTLYNYSVLLDKEPIQNMYIYGRCDRFVSGSSLDGWTLLSTTVPFQCWENVNYSNSSAYMWIKANCFDADVTEIEPYDFYVIDTSD